MPNWEQIVMTAVRTVRPDIAEKAEKELSNYGRDSASLKRLVADKGGEAFLDYAVEFANTAPKVKAMFDKARVKPEALRDNALKILHNPESKQSTSNPASSSMERLKKLR